MFSNNKWERNSKSLYVTKANGGYGGQTRQQYQFGEKQFFYSSVVLRDGSVRLIGELDDDVAVVAFNLMGHRICHSAETVLPLFLCSQPMTPDIVLKLHLMERL